jgi:Spy/CpxP family protein refolding chaperone
MSPLFGAGRMRLLGFALIAVTFLAGGMAGAAFDRVITTDTLKRDAPAAERRHLIDQVDMTADQRATIDAILERRSERLKSAWAEISPRLEAITDSARLEIMQVLTPAQRAEYERLLEERIRERERRQEDEARGG